MLDKNGDLIEEGKTILVDIETAGLENYALQAHVYQQLYNKTYIEIEEFLEKELQKDKYKLLLII